MKIRNGFVSNSSSSSFMLVGKSYSGCASTVFNMAREAGSSPNLVAFGRYLSEGQDIFDVQPDMVEFIDSHRNEFDLFLKAIEANGDYSGECTISKNDFPVGIDSLDVFSTTMDQHSTSSAEELLENYSQENSGGAEHLGSPEAVDTPESVQLLRDFFSARPNKKMKPNKKQPEPEVSRFSHE